MARPLRILVADGWSHVTSRGNRRESLYRTDADRQRLLEFAAGLAQDPAKVAFVEAMQRKRHRRKRAT